MKYGRKRLVQDQASLIFKNRANIIYPGNRRASCQPIDRLLQIGFNSRRKISAFGYIEAGVIFIDASGVNQEYHANRQTAEIQIDLILINYFFIKKNFLDGAGISDDFT